MKKYAQLKMTMPGGFVYSMIIVQEDDSAIWEIIKNSPAYTTQEMATEIVEGLNLLEQTKKTEEPQRCRFGELKEISDSGKRIRVFPSDAAYFRKECYDGFPDWSLGRVSLRGDNGYLKSFSDQALVEFLKTDSDQNKTSDKKQLVLDLSPSDNGKKIRVWPVVQSKHLPEYYDGVIHFLDDNFSVLCYDGIRRTFDSHSSCKFLD